MKRPIRPKHYIVTAYWLEYYVSDNHCSLCGNTGIIESRGVRTPAGYELPPKSNWCICPNGQQLRSLQKKAK